MTTKPTTKFRGRCKECDMYLVRRDKPYRPMCKACANDELDYLEAQEEMRGTAIDWDYEDREDEE